MGLGSDHFIGTAKIETNNNDDDDNDDDYDDDDDDNIVDKRLSDFLFFYSSAGVFVYLFVWLLPSGGIEDHVKHKNARQFFRLTS